MDIRESLKYYQTGIPEFDEHHLVIIGLVENLKTVESPKEIVRRLELMMKALKIHVRNEEEFMEKMNYPFFSFHKDTHSLMLSEIAGIIRYITNRNPIMLMPLTNIIDILKHHIEWYDLPYAEHFKKLNEQKINQDRYFL